MTTLHGLFGPATGDAIIQAVTGRKLRHFPAACETEPGTLFSTEQLELLLLQDGIGSCLRVTVNGTRVDNARFGILRDGRVEPLAVQRLTRQGASVIVVHLQRYLHKLWQLAADVQRTFGDRVQISSVSSFNRIPALKAHYDEWDLIIVQVEGTKLWRFLGEGSDCGIHGHAGVAIPSDVSATVVMRPGDAMFVPAGLHHQCEAEAHSLHFAIAIEHATIQPFLADLLDRHPSLNQPLRTVLGGEVLDRQIRSLTAELLSCFDEAEIASWLADWKGRRVRATRLGLGSDPGTAGDEAFASLAVTGLPVTTNGGPIRIAELELEPSPAVAAVLQLLHDGPRQVSDILASLAPELGSDEARAAIDELVAHGLVQVDPPTALRAEEQ